MKKICLIFLFFFGITFIHNLNDVVAQQVDLTKLEVFYNEVYLNSEYRLTPEVEAMVREKLGRVSFIEQAYVERENYQLLSSVSRKDKYNPSLNYSLTNFDVQTFNPLKYNFSFYENYNQFFRIDNTNYLLMIKSAN